MEYPELQLVKENVRELTDFIFDQDDFVDTEEDTEEEEEYLA